MFSKAQIQILRQRVALATRRQRTLLFLCRETAPNTDPVLCLGFLLVVWCLPRTTDVCAVCALPSSLILPSPLFLFIVHT